jgi:hypothetical protein
MKKGLLFDGVALNPADVAPWHPQTAAGIETDLADANRPVGKGAAMTARVAAEATVGKSLVQLSVSRLPRQEIS